MIIVIINFDFESILILINQGVYSLHQRLRHRLENEGGQGKNYNPCEKFLKIAQLFCIFFKITLSAKTV